MEVQRDWISVLGSIGTAAGSNGLHCLYRTHTRKALLLGMRYGIVCSLQFFALAATLGYGVQLLAEGQMAFYDVFR